MADVCKKSDVACEEEPQGLDPIDRESTRVARWKGEEVSVMLLRVD
jgi:hypothetical protein